PERNGSCKRWSERVRHSIARAHETEVSRRRRRHCRRARLHDLRRCDPVGRVLRHPVRARRSAGRRQGVPSRRHGPTRLGAVGTAHAGVDIRTVRRQGERAGAPQGRAARPVRRGTRGGRRGLVESGGLLPRDAHHGEALGRVQGATRREPGGRQGADAYALGAGAVIPEVGAGALIVALSLAVYGSAAAAIGGRTGRAALVASAQHAALGVFTLVTACLLLLAGAFLSFDFSVRYVANNTNLGTPFYYRLTAVWGALEGSIMLWAWMLSVYTLIVVVRHRTNARELYPWVLSVMLGVLAFFLLVMPVWARWFQRLTRVPPAGRGLNPLLEDSGMITHPVALYLGFTGFTVPFAFAIAALVTGRVGDAWITTTRRWTITAWYFL